MAFAIAWTIACLAVTLFLANRVASEPSGDAFAFMGLVFALMICVVGFAIWLTGIVSFSAGKVLL